MKIDLLSSYTRTFQAYLQRIGFAPVRKTATASLIASLLSGCSILNNPESVKFSIPGNTGEFKNRVYAGVAMGSSHLSPSTGGDGFSVDSSGDAGTQLRLGYDVHNMLAVEVDTAVLGTSSLRATDPESSANAEVKFAAASISALVYGWSGVQSRSRREGLSAYGRLGFAALRKSSNVVELDESVTVPILGIGAEYGFNNGLGIRTELTRYDSDATYVGFGAVYRFGISPQGIGRLIADAAEPALASKSTQVAKNGAYSGSETIVERYAGPDARPNGRTAPHLHYATGAEPDARYVGSMANRWRPAMRSDDRDQDGVLDHADSCMDTANQVTVDRHGCGLFDAVLHEVTFKSGSHWLTPRARAQLDLLAETLLAFPEARIQVRAHTDSRGPADVNLALSSRRAEVVVQYLQSRGVHELQLQAVGMGEAQPLDSNDEAEGRRRNRRVDVVTLPDQDAGQLLIASNFGSNAVMTVQNTTSAGTKSTTVGNDDWNSAPKIKKRNPERKPAPENKDKLPVLQAALPDYTHRSVGATASVKSGLKARRYTVAPLPRPGFAPDFKYSGVLTGVKFGQGASSLSEAARQSLEPLLKELQRNKSVRIAIMAHTDDQGGIDENKALSTQRADAVVAYLVSNGVDSSRLKAEGYGELLPLVQNVSESDRERNRRIEVRVLPAVQ